MTAWVPILVPLDRYPFYANLVATDAATLDLTSPTGWAHPVTTAVATRGGTGAGIETDQNADRAKALATLASMPKYGETELLAIMEGTTDTAMRWTKALDLCSLTPAEFLTSKQVADGTGMDVTQWRDAARKMYLVLRKIPTAPVWTSGKYEGQHSWPLLAWQFAGDTQVSWAVAAETAALWRRLRGLD